MRSRSGPAALWRLLAAAALWAAGVAALEQRAKCPASRQLEMDACASRLGFLGDHSFVVPKNLSAMDAFCGQLKEPIGCLQSYSRDCLQGFTRQILTSLMRRGKQQHSAICQSDAARAEFVAKMACLADDKIQQLNSCLDASVARFEFIRDQVRAEGRLPGLCCSYQIFSADSGQTLERLCGRTSEARRFVQKLVTGTTGELFQLICEGHRSMDECRASDKSRDTLARLEQVTKQAKAGKLKPRSKSLIPPLLDILDSSSL